MNGSIHDLDPAAIFAAATSLRNACDAAATTDRSLNLSEAYHGYDQLMREVMRIGALFESWACSHVAFEELGECWPYFLEDHFGAACLEVRSAESMTAFDESDCLKVAMELRLPVRLDDGLPLPLDVRADHPALASGFRKLRIQTVRQNRFSEDFETFAPGDDPFDPEWREPRYGLYGVDANGWSEHIADRATYSLARSLAVKLAPGVDFSERPIVTLAPLNRTTNRSTFSTAPPARSFPPWSSPRRPRQ